ncbi:TraR/DksA family transcriptional regulator [Comamonas testosteroni]|uniref:Transcriptional regulator, TraR/DksA family n=1 Tax=Comamonas testosteroni (strain DSM 14576 / KF-1) TaxID=399795 RepID=B7WXU2_COMTK|nr:TraR/DksA family transcriptional regulator [Comamonas testosteroni]EED67944.1 transcriptional regulator, TraR/DksA family [Comamonas testosteroni KF-1]WQG66062.1 TraR/DksA family transcriptional regulator [Comamonas testosteroni]
MTDFFDRAQARELQLREDALRDQTRRAGLSGKTEADSATECACGALIPEARRKAVPGCQRCVKCESAQERKKGRAL